MRETKMPNGDVRAEIILNQSDGQDVPVQVHLMDDTLWMPRATHFSTWSLPPGA